MKKTLLFSALLAASAFVSQAQMIDMDVIVGNRPPRPNEQMMMQREEQGHPNIAKAMHDIEKSMQALQMAHDDFGGHKAQAMDDLKRAYISLRKALYFKLYQDGGRMR